MATPFQKSSIGASAVAITGSSLTPRNGITVQAHPSNASGSVVYVGFAGVTASDGFALAPGSSVFIPLAECSNANLLYAIGSTTGLILSVWVM